MLPELFTRENIHTLSFPQTDDGDYARRYLIPLMTNDPQKYIRNVYNTQLMAVKVGETILPITVTDFHPQNTYTVSPYSHYVSYGGFEEVKHLNNSLAEFTVRAVMNPVAWYFRYSELDTDLSLKILANREFPDTLRGWNLRSTSPRSGLTIFRFCLKS